jgi:uncharacterized protein (DUF927 family)
LNGLPLCLDDTQTARHPDQVGQLIYDVTAGQGRGRGAIRGVQRSATWSGLLLTTGETKIAEIGADHGGTRA